MKNTILVSSVLLVTAGCASSGNFDPGIFTSSACTPPVSVVGFTPIGLKYGDSHLVVIPVAKIKANSEIRFHLIPQKKPSTDQQDYENAQVSISSPDDDGDTPANWLQVSGSVTDDGRFLTICVPPVLTRTTYKYDIKVEHVGQLDPRADVILE